MNFLKSVFVTFYVFGVFCFAIDALIHLLRSHFSTAWLGVSLVTMAPCAYYLSLFVYPRPRTQRYLNGVIIPIALGTVITIIGSIDTISGHTQALAYVILTLLGWILYEFWFSKINKISSAIKYGEKLSPFTLPNHQNQEISSKSFLGKPAILLFFRGNWCPFSYSLIQELINTCKNISQSIQIILISTQSSKKMHELASQIESDAIYLIDKKNQLAKDFDIEMKFSTPLGMQLLGYYSHSALPTIIMTDEQGIIIYTDIAHSFRVYPKPENYINLLQQKPTENQ